jgi:hypothetical protein
MDAGKTEDDPEVKRLWTEAEPLIKIAEAYENRQLFAPAKNPRKKSAIGKKTDRARLKMRLYASSS